jgi:uncharacterized protein (DUF1330 family)
MFIDPTGDQLRELAAGDPDEPIVMLNLLRFAGDEGAASYYEGYGAAVQPILERIGAHVDWQGDVGSVVIGDPDADRWDAVLLVSYPSRSAFLDMIRSPDYQEIAKLRAAGLADSRLIACNETFRSRR